MPNIISLPIPILSPTVADLFRGCEHGLLALAGKFNVDEKKKKPSPQGSGVGCVDKRKVKKRSKD